MMEDSDPRVKDLQNLAWGLQSLSNKPGGKLPEAEKRAAYKIASAAISLCTDAVYTEEADFLERAAAFKKQIEAKKAQLEQVEEAEKEKLAGKCYRASVDGNYVVGNREQVPSSGGKSEASQGQLSTSADSARTAPSLSASDVVARCEGDPLALRLVAAGLTDADLGALCEGLKGTAGAELTLLDLSSNRLADVGIQRLVGALAAGMCPKLRELRLGGNAFGPLGSQMLTGGLCALRKGLEVVTAEDPASVDGGGTASVASRAPPEAAEATPTPCEAAPAPSGNGRSGEAGEAGGADGGSGAAAFDPPVLVEVIEAPSDVAAGSGSQVRATVPVPEGCASSAADLELDISARRLVVRAALLGRVLADEALPRAVDPDSAQAAFSRKRRTLTVTLQVAC